MAVIYVARSAKLSKWGSDVGMGKNIYKVGWSDDAPDELVKIGWAGETDWTLLRADETEVGEDQIIERLQRKEKMIDPNIYPKLKGATGVFRVKDTNVENHMLVALALANRELKTVKLTPDDFAAYLIHNVLR